MSELDVNTSNQKPQKNRHFLGLLAGIGVGLVVGLILAGVGAIFEREIMLVVILGLAAVGYVVAQLVPNKSPMGAITGALACGAAFLFYMLFLGMFGYSYDDDSSFWITLVIAVVYGGVMGYKGKKGFEE